jgi:formylglycine-generating enzyme required for sulfatase activity
VRLVPGVSGSVRVALRGACFGTMADVRDFTALSTCVDTEHERVDLVESPIDPNVALPTSTLLGAFEAPYTAPCADAPRAAGHASDGTPLHDDQACVPGGAFVFGSRDAYYGTQLDGVPERVALVPSFLMDRYEVTVARFRKALAVGFNAGTPFANENPIGDSSHSEGDLAICTWSSTPRGREEFPVTCITQQTARAFCRFDGGDLPLEVQWEYAATAGGHQAKMHFTWSDVVVGDPPCKDVIYARGNAPGVDDNCSTLGWGPASVVAVEHPGGDVTPDTGLVDLGGNVGEIVVERFVPFASACWANVGLVLPSCAAAGPNAASRGDTWAGSYPRATARHYSPGINPQYGFRCIHAWGTP